MTEEKKGMLAASCAYVIFGLSYLFSKTALNVTDPIMLLCIRFSVTYILLNILAAARVMKLNLKGKKLGGPVLLGILQPVLYFILENYGLKYTTTSFTGMMSAMGPIFTAVMGALVLKEKPNAKQWLCICVSIAGVMMVTLKPGGGTNTVLGCACLLAAYFSGSFYSMLSRRLSRDFTAFELTYIMFTVGFAFFMALAFIQNGGETVSLMAQALSSRGFIIAVLYLGGLSSVGAYMLANYSLARLPVARSTIFQNLSTVVSVLSGVIIMGDEFTIVSLIAFVLILVGVYGVNRCASN